MVRFARTRLTPVIVCFSADFTVPTPESAVSGRVGGRRATAGEAGTNARAAFPWRVEPAARVH